LKYGTHVSKIICDQWKKISNTTKEETNSGLMESISPRLA